MVEQETDANNQQPSSGRGGIFALAGLAAFIVLAAIFLLPRDNGGGGGAGGGNSENDNTVLPERLTEIRRALAATENLDSNDAVGLWDSLQTAFPRDASIAINRALNRVLLVDELSATATGALATDEEKQAARSQLSNAISSARKSVDQYKSISDDAVTHLWLKSRVDLHEAALLPKSMTKSLRRAVFDRVSEALSGEIGDDPKSVILGGPLTRVLDELEDPIDGLPTDLLPKAAAAVGSLSDKHPGNLFLAIRAARLNIDSKSKSASQYVNRTYDLAQSIEPSLSETTKPIGLTPQELVSEITTAIDAEDWDKAGNRMLQWFNVLNPTEILKTDRRRASPHPLDRLSFTAQRRLSSEVIQLNPLAKGGTAFSFSTSTIDGADGLSDVLPIDFDLDLDDDLVTISESAVVQL
ncbi:MAG: hypothetical protein HKN47_24225, partial [Pirellulaceae bacterium]|nr:hypothetical protein [Pirellulaceae bacterium]